MPALLILAFISWLLGAGKSRATSDLPLFNALHIRRGKPWGGVAISAALHAIAIPLLMLAPEWFREDEDQKVAQWMVERSLIIRLPERIYLAQSNSESPLAPSRNAHTTQPVSKNAGARGNIHIAENTQGISQKFKETAQLAEQVKRPLKKVPRRFELPDLEKLELRTQTLLEAEIPPNLAPQAETSLPQLLFWAAEARELTARRPVTPGNRVLITQRPSLDAPPRLAPPNQEMFTSDLRIASAAFTAQPALPRPAATTMPIRALQSQPVKPAPGPRSIDPFVGDPIHVLAVSPTPAPLSEALKPLFVPAGNQIAKLSGDAAQFGTGKGSSPETPAGGDKPGSGTGVLGSPGGGASTAVASTTAADSGDPSVVHSLPGEGRVLGLLSPPALPDMAVRMVHPVNGVFDVIVVQSSPSEAFPETANSLSGRPVYTVYLQVGSDKEWILQYCVPNSSGSPLQSGSLIKLSNPAPVAAPYPVVTVRPPTGWLDGSGYLLVHGFLDASGRFRDMAILPGTDSSAAQGEALLQYLTHWEFRPALEDGRPVLVEVVLAVPPDKA